MKIGGSGVGLNAQQNNVVEEEMGDAEETRQW